MNYELILGIGGGVAGGIAGAGGMWSFLKSRADRRDAKEDSVISMLRADVDRLVEKVETQGVEIRTLRAQLSAAAADERFPLPLWRKDPATGLIVFANREAIRKIFVPAGMPQPLGKRMEEGKFTKQSLEQMAGMDDEAPNEVDHSVTGIIKFTDRLAPSIVVKTMCEGEDGEPLIQSIAYRSRGFFVGDMGELGNLFQRERAAQYLDRK